MKLYLHGMLMKDVVGRKNYKFYVKNSKVKI